MELWSNRVAPKNSELPVPSRGQVFSGERACSKDQYGLGTVTITVCHFGDWIPALVPRMKGLVPKRSAGC